MDKRVHSSPKKRREEEEEGEAKEGEAKEGEEVMLIFSFCVFM